MLICHNCKNSHMEKENVYNAHTHEFTLQMKKLEGEKEKRQQNENAF